MKDSICLDLGVMELKRVHRNTVWPNDRNKLFTETTPPVLPQSPAFPIGQNIKTGLAKVRRKPRGLVKYVIVKKGPRLWICLWQGDGRSRGVISKQERQRGDYIVKHELWEVLSV